MANPKGTIRNLIPAKKGEIRNPRGPHKKIPGLDVLLADLFGEDKNGESGARKVLLTLKQAAIAGKLSTVKVRAAEVLVDRIYGKAKSNDTLNVKIQSAKDIAESDEKAKEILEKYNLVPRIKKNE